MLQSDITHFIYKNKTQLIIQFILLMLAYGYFITNWAISIDSESKMWQPDFVIWAASQERTMIWLIDTLTNNIVLPYWNDCISVLLIFLSSIMWSINLSKFQSNKSAVFIFFLIFSISPLYVFYLRFTIFDITVSLAGLMVAISSYYLINMIIDSGSKFKYYIYSTFVLSIPIGIYQMTAVSFINSILIILCCLSLQNMSFNRLIKALFLGISVLISALIIYKITNELVYAFNLIAKGGYLNNFAIRWGHGENISVLRQLMESIYVQTFKLRFNFFMALSLFVLIIFSLITLIRKPRDYLLICLLWSLYLSAYILPIMLGLGMPLRSLNNIPLVLAGLWFIIYSYCTNGRLKSGIVILVSICTFFNAQFITILFYSDNMRLKDDTNYATQIFNYVLNNSGIAGNDKPLAIIGHRSYIAKPYYIIKSTNDTIGTSFFDIDVFDNYTGFVKLNYFMKWLGYEYKLPTKSQIKSAINLSFAMPSYPMIGSLKETESMIILKISNANIFSDQAPINIDMTKYKLIPSKGTNAVLHYIDNADKVINYSGFGYIKNKDALGTNIFIKFKSESSAYIFPCSPFITDDIKQSYKDGINLDHVGFYGSLNTTYFKPGKYEVSILFINNNEYLGEYYPNKMLEIK